MGLAGDDVRSRTEHGSWYAVCFVWSSLGVVISRVLILEVALQHLGFAEKLRGFTAAYPCTVLEIADRRAMGPTWDRDGAAPE
jgi:hypothetical protein